MDWADDVAYSVHDLEDGLHSGLITLEQLRDHFERNEVAGVPCAEYCPPGSVTTEERGEIFDQLMKLEFWPPRFDGEPQTAAAVKNLTSELIGRFCRAAERATQRLAGNTALSRYAADLDVPREQRLECALLKGVTAYYVMRREGAVAAQARGRARLSQLAQAPAPGAPGSLAPMFPPRNRTAATAAGRLSVV